jgi:hypothetical protein
MSSAFSQRKKLILREGHEVFSSTRPADTLFLPGGEGSAFLVMS